jgi:hypothetical protein
MTARIASLRKFISLYPLKLSGQVSVGAGPLPCYCLRRSCLLTFITFSAEKELPSTL